MTTLGKIDKFITATGDWTQYIERMNQFFIANEISEEPRKKVEIESHFVELVWCRDIWLIEKSCSTSKTIRQILQRISQSYE